MNMFKKFKVTRNYVSIMAGVCFILFSLVVLFSANTPFGFLIALISSTLGFVGFWLLLPFVFVVGLYLIMKKKVFKIRLGTELWGVFILIFCFFILTSHWGSWGTTVNGVEITGSGKKDGVAQYLTFSNSVSVFDKIMNANPPVIGANPKLGGGIVGYVIAGALNSAITPVGLNIVCWTLFIGSLLIIFNRQVKKVIHKIKGHSPRPRVQKVEEEVNINIDEFVPEEVAPSTQAPPPVEHKVFEGLTHGEVVAFVGQSHVQAPGAHDFPEQEEAEQILAGSHTNQTATHTGKGAVETPLRVRMFHIADGVGHIDGADDGHEQGKAEGEHVHVAAKQQYEQGREQKNRHTGHTALDAILGEESGNHGAEDRHDNIDGPRYADTGKNGAVNGYGTEAERSHRRHKLHGYLGNQSHQQAENGKYCQAQTHGERSFTDLGQVVGPLDEDDGFENASVVNGSHK